MPIDATQPYDDTNIFARILRGELPSKTVHEDEHTLAFQDINPLAPTHILVIPKGRYVSWDDFSAKGSDEEIASLVRAVGKIAREAGLVESGYRVLANSGLNSGQEVPHLHVHIFAGRPLGPMLAR
jgi:diadenosine tetraphosphate (Ap4A) HIT family hydrolase